MRVILDTNVLLSGLLMSQGVATMLLDLWQRNIFTIVACEELSEELRAVSERPFFMARLRVSRVEILAAGLRDFAFFCDELPAVPAAPDPKDTYLLSLAEASMADFLVTGDKKLQALRRHKTTKIISPTAMIELLRKNESSGE